MREVIWIRRLALIATILCLGVVVLGGYTRLSNSGLGCPDWPGCFGHIAPTGSAEHYATDLDVRKAWIEMIHRYFASTLGLIIVAIAVLAIRARRERGVNVWLAMGLVVLVVFQGMLGMLTVTWLLKPLIVTGHLLGGLATFALLLWLYLSMRARARPVNGHSVLAGNIGAPGRVNYTLVGDTVNVAQRIMELIKTIGGKEETVKILASGAVAARVGDDFTFLPEGEHELRGRDEVVRIFRLVS